MAKSKKDDTPELEYFQRYAKGVIDGTITAGRLVRLACSRYMEWFDRDDIYFDRRQAYKPVKFVRLLKHFKGEHEGESFSLMDWQEFVCYNVFGWYWVKSKRRVIKDAYIQTSRKQGKSFFSSSIALYRLLADGENGAEIEIVSPTHKQSEIAYDAAKRMIKPLDPNQKYLKYYRDRIQMKKAPNKIQILSSDAQNLDGFFPSFVICDELAAFESDKVYAVMKSGMVASKNPCIFSITTAHHSPQKSPAYAMRCVCVDILEGTKKDDTQFAYIAELDEGDDIYDENNWMKFCPALDVTVSREAIRDELRRMNNSPTLELEIRTKTLNQWVNSKAEWLSHNAVSKVMQPVPLDSFKGKMVWIGVDLSAVSDLTAVSIMREEDNKLYFHTLYYLPENCLEDGGSNKELYRHWAKKGQLTLTQGNVVDYDVAVRDILTLSETCFVQGVFYDRWNSLQFALKCSEQGLVLTPYAQNLGTFSAPTKHLEMAILGENCVIDSNPITQFCFDNVELKTDWNGNVKPVKQSGSNPNKIDGVISMIMSVGGFGTDTQRFISPEILPLD